MPPGLSSLHAEEGGRSRRPVMMSCLTQLTAPKRFFTLKVHKHEIFFLLFFAETETLWSQGPVTRDF
jgi:hypothetical protein